MCETRFIPVSEQRSLSENMYLIDFKKQEQKDSFLVLIVKI